MSTSVFISTIVCAIVASSGFWMFVQRLMDRKDVRTKMLVGLAHDRIIHLGMKYIEQGYVTSDQFENLNDYLYEPYKQMGGNGSAKKVMDEVKKLPIKNNLEN